MNRRSFILAMASAAAVGVILPYHKKLELLNDTKRVPLGNEILLLAQFADAIYPDAELLGFAVYLKKKVHRNKDEILRMEIKKLAKDLRDNFYNVSFKVESSRTYDDKRVFIEGRLKDSSWPEYQHFVDWVLESYYAAPRHGGNRNGKGWSDCSLLFKKEWMNG